MDGNNTDDTQTTVSDLIKQNKKLMQENKELKIEIERYKITQGDIDEIKSAIRSRLEDDIIENINQKIRNYLDTQEKQIRDSIRSDISQVLELVQKLSKMQDNPPKLL